MSKKRNRNKPLEDTRTLLNKAIAMVEKSDIRREVDRLTDKRERYLREYREKEKQS